MSADMVVASFTPSHGMYDVPVKAYPYIDGWDKLNIGDHAYFEIQSVKEDGRDQIRGVTLDLYEIYTTSRWEKREKEEDIHLGTYSCKLVKRRDDGVWRLVVLDSPATPKKGVMYFRWAPHDYVAAGDDTPLRYVVMDPKILGQEAGYEIGFRLTVDGEKLPKDQMTRLLVQAQTYKADWIKPDLKVRAFTYRDKDEDPKNFQSVDYAAIDWQLAPAEAADGLTTVKLNIVERYSRNDVDESPDRSADAVLATYMGHLKRREDANDPAKDSWYLDVKPYPRDKDFPESGTPYFRWIGGTGGFRYVPIDPKTLGAEDEYEIGFDAWMGSYGILVREPKPMKVKIYRDFEDITDEQLEDLISRYEHAIATWANTFALKQYEAIDIFGSQITQEEAKKSGGSVGFFSIIKAVVKTAVVLAAPQLGALAIAVKISSQIDVADKTVEVIDAGVDVMDQLKKEEGASGKTSMPFSEFIVRGKMVASRLTDLTKPGRLDEFQQGDKKTKYEPIGRKIREKWKTLGSPGKRVAAYRELRKEVDRIPRGDHPSFPLPDVINDLLPPLIESYLNLNNWGIATWWVIDEAQKKALQTKVRGGWSNHSHVYAKTREDMVHLQKLLRLMKTSHGHSILNDKGDLLITWDNKAETFPSLKNHLVFMGGQDVRQHLRGHSTDDTWSGAEPHYLRTDKKVADVQKESWPVWDLELPAVK